MVWKKEKIHPTQNEIHGNILHVQVHTMIVRIGFGRRCVESIVKYDERQGVLYQSVILMLPNLFRGKWT